MKTLGQIDKKIASVAKESDTVLHTTFVDEKQKEIRLAEIRGKLEILCWVEQPSGIKEGENENKR
jgi:hypothetical protein